MCGITGFIDFSKKTDIVALENASNQLTHRGKDEKGLFFKSFEDYTIGLASRRLSIIDISENGSQPMFSKCKNYILVFNGTIYNYKELKSKLLQQGYKFSSSSDTEVLLAAYIKWGKDFLNLLNGIFAFCIYDILKQQIIIARDNLGVKPLFYTFNSQLFSFSSELKALESYLPEKEIDKKSLSFFLKHGYFPTDATIFKNKYKVEAGEVLEFDLNTKKLSEKYFWKLPNSENSVINEEESTIIQKTHDLLKKSILSRTIADTDIGVLLSGGFDSSLTAAIIQKNNTHPINTFTIGFEDNNIDESVRAKDIANHLKTNHHDYILKKEEAIETIKNIGKIYDEPMGDSGAIALYAAAKLASNKVKVLLSSEGGDELFAGYTSYSFSIKWFPIFSRIPKLNFLNIIHPKISSLLGSKTILEFYNNVNAYFTDIEIASLIKTNSIKEFSECNRDGLNQLLSFDLKNYLPEDLLMKADRTCMYWGIENRDAFLDIDLVSYAQQIPQETKLKNNIKKYILKEIAYKYIPKELLNQPKKGFSIPIDNWLQTDLKDFVVSHLKDSTIYNLVDKDEVNKILHRFLKHKRGYSRKIWILLALKLWADEHYDREL